MIRTLIYFLIDLDGIVSIVDIRLHRNLLSGTIPNEIANSWESAFLIYLHENNLNGNLTGFCDNPRLIDLFADCDDDVTCPCCNYCCTSSNCVWTGYGEEGTGEEQPTDWKPPRSGPGGGGSGGPPPPGI